MVDIFNTQIESKHNLDSVVVLFVVVVFSGKSEPG